MRELFGIALCLFVSCDDDSSVVSTWKYIDEYEDNGYSYKDTTTVVFYDDDSFAYSVSKECFENGNYQEDMSGSQSYTGTYKATSEKEGTFSIVMGPANVTGSYTINGNEMTVSIQEGSDIVYIVLDKA